MSSNSRALISGSNNASSSPIPQPRITLRVEPPPTSPPVQGGKTQLFVNNKNLHKHKNVPEFQKTTIGLNLGTMTSAALAVPWYEQ